MAYNPLHHKYRPQTFAQLVGQATIAATLTNAIASQRIAPAYLFTGPRGTGKTSSARIFAKSLNCQSSAVPTAEPCGQCDSCRAIANGSALDVIEIDAASNTGVDNIRDLIERAQFAPVSSRYKVYVIDECHMLSTAAFNALLKTLEEPPPRVIFVLATTDPQRVLPTIISRCQRFDFRRIPLAAMTEHLRAIAHQEQIEITDPALALVAQIANGGLRDAESLLDQLSLLPPPIEPEAVWDLVGAVPERDLLALLQAIRRSDPEAVIDHCRHLLDRGREPLAVLQSLANFYLHLLIAKTAPQRSDLIAVTSATWAALGQEAQHWTLPALLRSQQQLKASESQLRPATQPRLWLELALLELLPAANLVESAAPEAPARNADDTLARSRSVSAGESPRVSPATPPSAAAPAAPPTPAVAAPAASEPAPPPPAPEPAAATETSVSLPELWQRVLDHLQPPATKALLSQQCCLLDFDAEGAIAYVGVKSQKLLKMAQAKTPNIKAAFEQVQQHPVQVELQVAAGSPAAPAASPRPSSPRAREASPPPLAPQAREPEPEPEPEPPAVRRNGNRPAELLSDRPPAPLPEPIPPAPSALAEPPTLPPALELAAPPVLPGDLEAIAQQVARSFNGEAIELDLDLSASAPLETTEPELLLSEPGSDAGDDEEEDIPF